MASGIKGITIQLAADGSKLTDALYQADKAASSAQKSLENVNKALKFDPTNVDLLKQKQEILKQKIDATKSSIETMKQALAEMDANGVSQTSEKYTALQREIAYAENSLKSMNQELAHTEGYVPQLEALGNSLKGVSDKCNELASKFKWVSAAAAGALGASVSYASDLEESMNKVGVAFGDSADEVEKFASTALTSYGIAEGTALDMAATFGDMATSMGLSQKEASKMSTSLVGLAGDLASFKNIGIEQATTALNGVFTGETESLKTLGIVMTQTNLDAYALANGFGKTTSEMTEAEKVMLRYQYVLDATKNSQGDFANTSEGVANQLRIFKEGIKQLAASLGEVLLPYVSAVLQRVNDFIAKLSEMPNAAKVAVDVILLLAAALAPTLLAFGTVTSMISKSLIAFAELSAKLPMITGLMQGLWGVLAANPILAVVAAIAALSAAFVAFGGDADALGAKISEFVTNFVTKATELIPTVVAAISENLPQIIECAATIIIALAEGLIKALPSLIKAAPKIIKAIVKGLVSAIGDLWDVGVNIVKGLWQGAKDMVNWVVDKFKGLGKSILKGIKGALGIKSPSRVFRDQVGKNIVLGLAQGINNNQGFIKSAMANMQGNLAVGAVGMIPSTIPTLSSVSNEMVNAVGTGMALANSGSGTNTATIVVNLGGAKVAEQIFRLNKQGALALQG